MNCTHNRMKRWMVVLALCFASACMTGCGRTRTVYVMDDEPSRLREEIKSAKVWVFDKQSGKEIEGERDLREGQWVVSDPGEEEAEKPNP